MLPNGLVLHGQPEMPTVGFFVKKDGLNWFDSVDVRFDETHRPAAHGSFDVPVTLGSRLVQVDGYCFAESEAALEHMGNQLKGVLADGGKGRVQVQWNGSTTWADVRLGSQTKFSPNRHSLAGEFQFTFWAADPRKFGETRTFGPASSMVVYHSGNFPASPVLTVTGDSVGGYTIQGEGGRRYVVTKTLVPG